MKRSRQLIAGCGAVFSLFVFFGMMQPTLAAKATRVDAKGLTIIGKKSVIKHKGSKPVRVNDKLRVDKNIVARKNITLRSGYTVDGVDVSALSDTVDALPLLPTDCVIDQVAKFDGTTWECASDESGAAGTTYTAGTGISITDGVITSTVVDTDTDTNTTYTAGTGLSLTSTEFAIAAISSAMISDGVVSADDLGPNSVSASELASNAIESGDIELGDLPTLGSGILSDASSIAMLSDAETILGDWVNTAYPWNDGEVANAITIDGGTIDSTAIGATTASTGNFTQFMLNDEARSLNTLQNIPHDTKTTVVDSTGDVGVDVSITIGLDGLPILAYYDTTNRDLKVLKCGNSSCSAGNTSTRLSTADNDGRYANVAIGSDGLPVVSHYNLTSADLMLVKCGNAACSSGNSEATVVSSLMSGSYSSMAIGVNGFPVIAYYESSASDLWVVRCGDATCETGNVSFSVDSADAVGQYASLAIGIDGSPIISYYDATNGDLKVVHCGNSSCTSGNTITSADTTDDVGLYTSISIGNDGLAVIAYQDVTNSNLEVLHCGNSLCSSGNTITTADNTSGAGSHTSISVGYDGLPIIGFAATGNDAYTIKCGNSMCTGNNKKVTIDGSTTYTSKSIATGEDGLPILAYYNSNTLDLVVSKAGNKYFMKNWTRR